MNNSDTYKNKKGDKDPLSLFDGGSVSWDKSREDIWASIDSEIKDRNDVKIVSLRSRNRLIAAAAVIVFLIAVPTLMRYYTRTVECMAGEHLSVILPDNSEVELNAGTSIEYNPLWWRFKREVRLAGEAFFEVEKGSDFEVVSDLASTMVVGTSFNIIARADIYEVTCLSGKVKVSTSDYSSDILLSPNQKAVLDSEGSLIKSDIKSEQSISWIDDEFFFTSTALKEVFNEIERQFDISIEMQIKEELFYTGNFSRNNDPEQVLNLVCKVFGIKFETDATGTYIITKDEQPE